MCTETVAGPAIALDGGGWMAGGGGFRDLFAWGDAEWRDARERIRAITANDRQALVVARCDGVVCGLLALDFMYYLPLGTTTCRITALVVRNDAQGRGLGRRLLKEAERRARFGGAARLEITSGSQRSDAHAFYKACGYSDGTLRFIKHLGDA